MKSIKVIFQTNLLEKVLVKWPLTVDRNVLQQILAFSMQYHIFKAIRSLKNTFRTIPYYKNKIKLINLLIKILFPFDVFNS